MLLYPPKLFDQNEWFVLLTIVAGYIVMALLPQRYPRAMSVLIVLFCVSAAYVMDHAIASPPLDLYDINDRKEYEWIDLVTYLMYSPYALLCVYIYHKLRPRKLWFTGYIIGWSLFCVFFEWLAIMCHVFTFHGWSLVYSYSVYIVMTVIHLWFFEYLLRNFYRQDTKEFVPDVDSKLN